MKLFTRSISLFCCSLFIGVCPISAQQAPTLSADFHHAELRSAISQLEKNYPISFSFDDEAIRGVQVTAKFENLPLKEALKHTLQGTGLEFDIVDNQYILIRKTGTPFQPPVLSIPPPLLSICGQIFDAATAETLPGATAYIKNSPFGTTSETDGKFRLEGDFGKDDSLIISYLGYKPQAYLVRPLLVKPCQSYRLQVDILNMPDVLIQDFATDMIRLADEGGFHFDKAKMPTLPGWGEPDVLRTLQLLPGIGSTDESGSRLNVRGGTPDQNLVLLDGIPIYHTGHFFGLYDAFNPFVVDDVEVWRGNFGANYGSRNSSVIDIETKQGYGSKTRWGIGMNLLSLQAYVDIPLKKERMSLLFAFRRSYIDGLQSTAYKNFFDQIFQNGKVAFQEQESKNDTSITWNPSINFGDANLKLRWRGKKTAENALSLFTTGDRLDYQFTYDNGFYFGKTEDKIAASNTGISWLHSAQWSPVLKVKYSAAISGYANDYTFLWNEQDRLRPFIYRWETKNMMSEVTANFHHDWQVGEHNRMSFGYQFTGQEARLIYRDTNAVTLEGNLWSNDTARTALHTLYAEFAYQPTARFDFTLGVRENHFPARELYYSEPRVNFNWFPYGKHPDGSTLRLKAGLGRYWQFVFQIVDVGDLGVGEPLWGLANDYIPAQELWQCTFGLGVETKTMLLDMEFYSKKNRNLTSSNLRVEQGFEVPYVFDGESIAKGLDFLFRKRWQNYSLWLSLSFGEVAMKFPELNGGLPFPARHDIRRRMNWVNTYSWKKWEFAANLHLRSGTPYSTTPAVVQVPCPGCTADSITYALNYERLNTARLPNIVRLDLSATWKWKKPKNHGKLGLAIYNATNRRNLLDKDYLLETPPHNEPQTSYTVKELYRLAAGATPSIFVMFEW